MSAPTQPFWSSVAQAFIAQVVKVSYKSEWAGEGSITGTLERIERDAIWIRTLAPEGQEGKPVGIRFESLRSIEAA